MSVLFLWPRVTLAASGTDMLEARICANPVLVTNLTSG